MTDNCSKFANEDDTDVKHIGLLTLIVEYRTASAVGNEQSPVSSLKAIELILLAARRVSVELSKLASVDDKRITYEALLRIVSGSSKACTVLFGTGEKTKVTLFTENELEIRKRIRSISNNRCIGEDLFSKTT